MTESVMGEPVQPDAVCAAAVEQTQALPQRPDTPCVAVCSTTFDDVCRGCGRTVVEVAHWVSMSDADKELVWQRILSQGYPRRNK
ncbi:MAG: hypothetical protein JWP59_2739 [Massilia sp.]|jgi:predicted Fe-S protein YdhL (DUF1289 family)|nr:hypothetical protein [Massilia sp.]